MKFTINSKHLLGKLLAVGRVIPSKSPIRILNSFLLEVTEDNRLHITGSDQETVVEMSAELASHEGIGKFCVDAKRIITFLRAMPDNNAEFIFGDNLALKIKYTNGEYELMCNDANEYPFDANGVRLESDDAAMELSLPSMLVLNALDKVAFATSTEDVRMMMQGVCWDIKNDAIVFVASDTRKLAKYRTTQVAPGFERIFVLPNKTIPLLQNIIGKEEVTNMTINTRNVIFKGRDYKIFSAIIAGNYPNYDRVIPQNHPYVMTIDKEKIQDAVSRVGICAEQSNPLVKMTLDLFGVVLTSQDLNYSTNASEMVACDYNGQPMDIGFSADFLTEVLRAVTTSKVNFKFSAPNAPAVILPAENDEYGEHTLLLMPMQISPL